MIKEVKVVGYYKGISKKNGREYVNLSVTYKRQPGDSDVEIFGEVAETFFVPDYMAMKVGSKDVGQTIKIVDAFYGNQNHLIDILR